MRMFSTCVILAALAFAASAQVTTTSRLDGTVTDAQGAAVPGAQVQVVLNSTGQTFKVAPDEKGYWVIASLQNGTYRVTVAHQGFKTGATDNIQLDAGVPATVNVALEVGAVTETVVVTAGAEVVQADTAKARPTLRGGQIRYQSLTSHHA